MRIAIDLQGLQSDGSRIRGIGRYSFSLIKSLLINFPENEYILVANGELYNPRSDFQEFISNSKFKVTMCNWYSPIPMRECTDKDAVRVSIGRILRTYAFANLNSDIILLTSFFEGYTDNCITDFVDSFDLPPIASVFYDLIPLLNRDLYLKKNPGYEKFYLRKVDSLSKFNGLLSISQSSANEASNFLNIDKTKVYNISSAIDKNIFNTKECNNKKYDFGEFILYTGAGDPRKNLKNLLEAYSRLDQNLMMHHNLVLVGKLLSTEKNMINIWIENLQIPKENIKLLGYVSDSDLANLYRRCYLFIFPSFHEGFGLPVLEAMSCGAPVIASNSTSIPEIINQKSDMFDPFDVNDMTRLLKLALNNKQFYNQLKENSKVQSSCFSWELCADNLMGAINNVIKNNTNLCKTSKRDNYPEENYKILLSQIINILSTFDNKRILGSFINIISACIQKIIRDTCYFHINKESEFPFLQWRIEGPYDSTYSLAKLNRELALALKRVGCPVWINSMEGAGNYDPNLDFLALNKDLLDLHNNSLFNTKRNEQIVSRNLYPPNVSNINSRLSLLHAYGWEETVIPSDWVEDFNHCLDGISVMSSFVKNVLMNNGVTIPISICGLGVDHVSRISPKKFFLKAKRFKFLHVSSCFPRKGVDLLVSSYISAFTYSDDVSLIIKTFKNPHNNLNEIIDNYNMKNLELPHIVVIEDDLSDEEILYLYNICDALVAPSRGEGFGLPIAEAMLCNLPVITTAWGGQRDFCDNKNSWLIDYEYQYSRSHFDISSSVWAEPSKKDLTRLLKEIRSLSDEDIKRKTDAAKSTIENQYIWTNVANKNLNFAKLILRKSSSFDTSKIGWVSTWDSKCGIASYSKNLIKEMSHIERIFGQYGNYQSDSLGVTRCWELDDNQDQDQDLEQLFDKIIIFGCTSVVFQFNFGFFNREELANLFSKLSHINVKTFLFLHSTIGPENVENKSLFDYKKVFLKSTKIFVHSVNDLNCLKQIGVNDNVSIFPHGILDCDFLNFDTNNGKKILFEDEWLISSYGFCLPHKGFLELIQAISLLREEGINAKLRLYTSLYNEDYGYFVQELKEEIVSLNISEYVFIDTSYSTDFDSLQNLSKSDLLVFPYQSSNESSSAAVRHGISSGRPILVTPLKIFDDIQSCVDVLPGFDKYAISSGIKDHMKHRDNNIDNYIKNQQERLQYIKDNSFSKLSLKLNNIIKAYENDIYS